MTDLKPVPCPDVEALEALYQKATPGEWRGPADKPTVGEAFDGLAVFETWVRPGGAYKANRDWIVALHNQWPSIAAALRDREAVEARNDVLDAQVGKLRGALRANEQLMAGKFQTAVEMAARLEERTAERDELKAECERLRARVEELEQRAVDEYGRGLGIGMRIGRAEGPIIEGAALTPSEKEKQT